MKIDSDEVTKLADAFNQVYWDDKPQADCPDSEKIMGGVRGLLPRHELKDLVQHVADCPLCGESWRMAWKLEHQASPFINLKGIAAIAAAALVLLIGYQQFAHQWGPPQDPIIRSVPQLQLELLSGLGPYSRQAFRLRWTEFEAATYNLRVTTEDFSIKVQETRLADAVFLVPEASLEGVPPGAKLRVYIEAHLPGQNPVSRTFDVQLE